MKKRFLSLIIIFFSFSVFSNEQKNIQNGSLIAENCYMYKLENGLTLFVAENHSVPLAYIEIAVRAGAITQTKENAGLFHLYEHMMFKGNKKFSNTGKVQKALSDMGTASWNGTTGIECVNYYFTIPSSELENGLDFWNNAIRFPLLDENEFDIEKKVVIAEIQGDTSSPSKYIGSYINSHLFDKPWQLDPGGSVENIQNATLEQLKEIQKTFYIPQNAALFVGGDVEHKKVFELVKNIYGDWSNNGINFEQIEEAVETQSSKPFDKPYFCVVPFDKIDSRQTQIMIYFRGPDADFDEDATYPADLLGFYMENPESDFVQDFVNDPNLMIPSEDFLGSGYSTRRRTGLTSFLAVSLCPPEKVVETTKNFYSKVMSSMKMYSKNENIVPSEKRKKIIQRLKDDKIFQTETFMGILTTLRYNWITNSVDYYLNYEKNIENVSNEQIQNYLSKYIVEKNPLVIVLVNPSVYEKNEKIFNESGFEKVVSENSFWWNK